MSANRHIPCYKLGTGISISMNLHKENRQRLCERMLKTGKISQNSYILLIGDTDHFRGRSDAEYVFRQESYFHWTFGVLEPGFFGAIDINTGSSILFMPKLDEVYATFMGELQLPQQICKKYDVDEVYFVEEIAKVLREKNVDEIHTLYGLNTDSGEYTMEAKFDGMKEYRVINDVLHYEITECRVIKTEKELEVMRYVNKQSSLAHRNLMRTVSPGIYEYQVESIFLHNCYFHGAMRHVSYTCIGATGCNCSVLHYGHAGAPNDRQMLDGDMCLFDMGGEYYCYSSDITCSYPVNGKFTPDQRFIYEAVLAASRAVMNACKEGVSWVDMHLLSEKTLLTKLKEGGLVKGEVDEMMKVRLGAVFMPHGLGHLMGLDVHDVGGYSGDAQPRSKLPGLKSLRLARILKENMVLTIEPGCYFINFLLNKAKNNPDQSKFLNNEQIYRFMNFGGVRIEDDVVIKKDGIELLTDVPRTCDEIETWMATKAN